MKKQYKTNLKKLIEKFGLTYFQARKVMKEFNAMNKNNESPLTLNEYLKPMLKVLNELKDLGEFDAPKDNPEGIMSMKNVKLMLEDDKVVSFDVMHNIPSDFHLSLTNSIDTWIMETDNFTAESLSKWFADKKTGYKLQPNIKTD